MRNKIKIFFYALACSSSLFFNGAFASENDITVRADFWCPYNCHAHDDKPGYMIEILQKTFGKEHIKYEELNWARAVKETKEGTWDALVGAAKVDAPDFYFPESTMGIATNCFYVKPETKWHFTGIFSLNSVSLGIIRDYTYFEDLGNYIKLNSGNNNKVQVHFGNDALLTMIQKLETNRIMALVEDPNVIAQAYTYHPNLYKMKEVGCFVGDPLYVAFPPINPKSKERAEKLNKQMIKMENNGEMAELLKKYGVKPWYKE